MDVPSYPRSVNDARATAQRRSRFAMLRDCRGTAGGGSESARTGARRGLAVGMYASGTGMLPSLVGWRRPAPLRPVSSILLDGLRVRPMASDEWQHGVFLRPEGLCHRQCVGDDRLRHDSYPILVADNQVAL